MVVSSVLICLYCKNPFWTDDYDILEIIAVLMCFIGFIAYFLMILFSNIILLSISILDYFAVWFLYKLKGINRDISELGVDFDTIDNDIKNDTLKDGISVGSSNIEANH